jgi:hypothetical protein
LLGNLERLPDPHTGHTVWRSLVILSQVVWEVGGLPRLVADLYDLLDAELPSWDNGGFEQRFERALREFADRDICEKLPGALRHRLRQWGRPHQALTYVERTILSNTEDQELWARGLLQRYGQGFDITPVAARQLLRVPDSLSEDDAEALRRRRLNNAPMARWLASWAASVEERLRHVVMNEGASEFHRQLCGAPPLFDSRCQNRHEELINSRRRGSRAETSLVDAAATADLVRFLGVRPRYRSWSGPLESWREARNRVVHECRADRATLMAIAQMVHLLLREGF